MIKCLFHGFEIAHFFQILFSESRPGTCRPICGILITNKSFHSAKTALACSFHASGKNGRHLRCRNVMSRKGCAVQNEGITLKSEIWISKIQIFQWKAKISLNAVSYFWLAMTSSRLSYLATSFKMADGCGLNTESIDVALYSQDGWFRQLCYIWQPFLKKEYSPLHSVHRMWEVTSNPPGWKFEFILQQVRGLIKTFNLFNVYEMYLIRTTACLSFKHSKFFH